MRRYPALRAVSATAAMTAGLLLLPAAPAGAEPDREPGAPDVEVIVHRLDSLYRSKSSYSELEMEITTPDWQRTLVMKAWTVGLSHTLIRITAPAKERGLATLRVENEMWNYLPKTNKVIKVPPSMMMGSWMGSDFTNDDLVKETTRFDDYDYAFTTVADAADSLLYVDFRPHEDVPVVWKNIVVALRADDYIPVWERYYDERGELMRVMRYSDIRTFSGRKVPAVMELVPQNKEGHLTVIRYLTLELDIPVADETFSLRNLRTPE